MDERDGDWERIVHVMGGSVDSMVADLELSDRLLLRTAAAMHRYLEQLRGRLRVGASDLDAIFALWDGGRCTPTELGRRVVLTRAAITTLADRLVHAGLAERLTDPGDRRRILLVVTPRTDRLICEATAELRREVRAFAGADPAWPELARTIAALHGRFTAAAEVLSAEQGARSGVPRSEALAVLERGSEVPPDHW